MNAQANPVSSFEAPRNALLARQAEVLEAIVRGDPLPSLLDALCRIVEDEAAQGVRASILLVDPRHQCLRTGGAPSLPDHYNAAVDGIGIAPGVGTCADAAATGRVVVTPDFEAAPGWDGIRHLPLALGLRGAWSMPIRNADGEVLGTFGTYFPEVREPTDDERTLVAVLAQTAALAIERQRSDAALRASERRHRFLADLAAATQQLDDAAEVMATSARMLAEHLGVDRCAYAEIEGETPDDAIFVVAGDHPIGVPSIVGRWPMGAFGEDCTRCMFEGRPYIVDDTEHDARIAADDLPAYRATLIRAVICLPLLKRGKLTAAMAVHQKTPRRWTHDEVELVERVVGGCWEALQRLRVTRGLRDSEAAYRAMVDANPECVTLIDTDGTILQINASGLAHVQADAADEIVGANAMDLVAPEHREAYRALHGRVCAGEPATMQFDLVGRRGAHMSMETTAVPLPVPGGGFRHLALTRDMTERMRADRALEQSRQRLDIAVRLSGVGFFYCDLPFDELMWDERVRDHFFMAPGARVTIADFYARLHPEDREPTRTAIDASIARNEHYDVVYRTVHPRTGEWKWIRALGGASYGPDGTPVRFDGVTLDITAERSAQEHLARMLEGERENARLLGRVAEAARTIHACDSIDAVLRAVADASRRILGAQVATAALLPEDEHAQPISMTSFASGAVPGVDEPRRWLVAPMVGHDGADVGRVQVADKAEGESFTDADEAILRQFAQIAAVALENARLYERLRDQDRRKDEFLATLAHELRNPLAPIRTGLHILRMTTDAAMAEKSREVMERQLGHLVRLVDDLLDVSRITRGKVTLTRERLDLRTVVDSAVELARPLIDAGGHHFELTLPDAPLPVDGDRTRLAQVLANLLNNAAKYTRPGGHIALDVNQAKGCYVIQVRDDGVGIPAEMLPRVFDMFTQVDQSIDRAQGGLGIGLTLVRRLVGLHGGSVDVSSPGVGQGSTFTVKLPAP
jgi:PAS domain S-box-containing protein